MGVNVEWKAGEEGRGGIVAEGTYLLDAARRLGVPVPTECGGRGECDTCAVVVEEGATLLSSLTDAERTRLSPGRLAAGERLACQAKVEQPGDLRLRNVPVTVREETTEETSNIFRDEFRKLPLRKKLATLAELEATAAYDTIVAVAEVPIGFLQKGLDLLAGRGRKLDAHKRESRRPAEHVQKEPAAPEGGAAGGGAQ